MAVRPAKGMALAATERDTKKEANTEKSWLSCFLFEIRATNEVDSASDGRAMQRREERSERET